MFHGETSKNVHDIRKMCLEMTLSVKACLVEFYVFVLDELYVRGVNLIDDRICVGNFWETMPKDQPKFLDEGPKLVVETGKGSSPTEANRRSVARSTVCG